MTTIRLSFKFPNLVRTIIIFTTFYIYIYENGKSEPSIATLMQMADIFNTSVDYIIGYTNVRQPIDKTVQMSLTEDECDLLSGYRELSQKQQNIAIGIIIGLLSSGKN
ncbi:helix-turn-helix domain-containing protein [Ruminococcus sp.]|uniref:helix-turn-helix domain-containing protein n=1 Tax=Ruminococcus sp. TaxID=41978 RepID=UPI00386B734F